jgi:hypothetical protein
MLHSGCYLGDGVDLGRIRRTVDDTAAQLGAAASDAKTTVVALAVLSVAALAVALVALAAAIGRN